MATQQNQTQKNKVITVDETTHLLFKMLAITDGMTMKEYMSKLARAETKKRGSKHASS